MTEDNTLTFLQQQVQNVRITLPGSSVQNSVAQFILKQTGAVSYFMRKMYNRLQQ